MILIQNRHRKQIEIGNVIIIRNDVVRNEIRGNLPHVDQTERRAICWSLAGWGKTICWSSCCMARVAICWSSCCLWNELGWSFCFTVRKTICWSPCCLVMHTLLIALCLDMNIFLIVACSSECFSFLFSSDARPLVFRQRILQPLSSCLFLLWLVFVFFRLKLFTFHFLLFTSFNSRVSGKLSTFKTRSHFSRSWLFGLTSFRKKFKKKICIAT